MRGFAEKCYENGGNFRRSVIVEEMSVAAAPGAVTLDSVEPTNGL